MEDVVGVRMAQSAKFQSIFEGNQSKVNKAETLLCQHFKKIKIRCN